jgi:hypothetical protein
MAFAMSSFKSLGTSSRKLGPGVSAEAGPTTKINPADKKTKKQLKQDKKN